MGKSKLSAEEKLKWVNNYTTQGIVALPLKRTNYHINLRIAKFKAKFAV